MARLAGQVLAACLMLFLLWLPPLVLLYPFLIRDCVLMLVHVVAKDVLALGNGKTSITAIILGMLRLLLIMALEWWIPQVLIWWVLKRRILCNWMASWWWWVKGLFVFYTAEVFTTAVLSRLGFGYVRFGYGSEDVLVTLNMIWIVSLTFNLWRISAIIFYLKLEVDERKRESPPRWVGQEGSIRHGFWRGFIDIVLQMARWAWRFDLRAKDTSFGGAHEASLREVEQAGLL